MVHLKEQADFGKLRVREGILGRENTNERLRNSSVPSEAAKVT